MSHDQYYDQEDNGGDYEQYYDAPPQRSQQRRAPPMDARRGPQQPQRNVRDWRTQALANLDDYEPLEQQMSRQPMYSRLPSYRPWSLGANGPYTAAAMGGGASLGLDTAANAAKARAEKKAAAKARAKRNPWIAFVREFAESHKIGYATALSDPVHRVALSAAWKKKQGVDAKSNAPAPAPRQGAFESKQTSRPVPGTDQSNSKRIPIGNGDDDGTDLEAAMVRPTSVAPAVRAPSSRPRPAATSARTLQLRQQKPSSAASEEGEDQSLRALAQLRGIEPKEGKYNY
jgi:hypothetical protein